MRGLAAQVVADCDQQLRQILLHYGRTSEKAAEISESIKTKVIAFSEAQREKLDTFNSLEELIHGLPVSSGILFSEAKERARSENGADEARELLRSLKNYPNKVLFRRNTLAHALEERTDDGWIIHREGGKPLTREDFERYRAEFLSHHRDVYALRELLVAQ